MASEKRTILRTVRLNPTLDKYIKEIAENENRTVSNTIYNLLCQSINQYVIAKVKREKRIVDAMYDSLALNEYHENNEDNED